MTYKEIKDLIKQNNKEIKFYTDWNNILESKCKQAKRDVINNLLK